MLLANNEVNRQSSANMKELTKFIRWADSHRSGRGLLCHFYTIEGKKQKQYYTKTDYAYFNLISDSPNWIVKGTTGHGIRSTRGKVSKVPCLNCYKVDTVFYEALDTLINEGNKKFEFGLILDKLVLKEAFEVIDVSHWDHTDSRPPPSECWRYDITQKRPALWPFNNCEVVRVRIPETNVYGLPIRPIPRGGVVGLLVKQDGYDPDVTMKLLDKKKGDNAFFEVFDLL